MVIISAAATATKRVEITPTLYVLPMHNAVRVAKEIATLNVISGGRVKKVVLGYGGRPQDYEAVGAVYNGRYQRMDHQVRTLKQVWSGHEIIEGAGSIGPDLAPEEHPFRPELGPEYQQRRVCVVRKWRQNRLTFRWTKF